MEPAVLQNSEYTYLAKLMARRWFRCAVCYITFKTRFSLKEHMKSGTHLMATGPAGVEGIFVGEFMLLLDRSKPVNDDIFSATAVT